MSHESEHRFKLIDSSYQGSRLSKGNKLLLSIFNILILHVNFQIKISISLIFSEFTEEEQTGLLKHNEFRAIHDAPPMKLDRNMCDEAKEYAETIAQMGGLKHSADTDRPGQGENLSMGCSTNMAQAIEEAVENW